MNNLSSFTDEIRTDNARKFRLYQEMIPGFENMEKPLTDVLNNIDNLLSGIASSMKELEEKCEDGENCENCMDNAKMPIVVVNQKTENIEITAPNNENEADKVDVDKTKEIQRIVALITDDDFRTIPKYQLGRFTIDSLNEIIDKIEGFLMKKNKVLTKSNKQLTRQDRELLDKWRELEEKSKKRLHSQLFFLESDIRPLLQEKLRPSFIKCIPCLRHIQRIREERCGPLTFYFPC